MLCVVGDEELRDTLLKTLLAGLPLREPKVGTKAKVGETDGDAIHCGMEGGNVSSGIAHHGDSRASAYESDI